jgi:A/G-specific adenine glycosylase
MSEVPGTDWSETVDVTAALEHAPFQATRRMCKGEVKHTFTHFHLRLTVFRADELKEVYGTMAGAWWSPANSLEEEALPTVMRKALALALD